MYSGWCTLGIRRPCQALLRWLRSLCAHSVREVPLAPQAYSRWVVGHAAARGSVRCAGGAPVVSAIFALMTNTCWPSLGLGESACSRLWFTASIICLFLLVWRVVHIFSVQVLYEVCFLQVCPQTVACVLTVSSSAFGIAEVLNFDDVQCTSFALMDYAFGDTFKKSARFKVMRVFSYVFFYNRNFTA